MVYTGIGGIALFTLKTVWQGLREIWNSGPDEYFDKVRNHEDMSNAQILQAVPDDAFVLVSSLGEAIADIGRNRNYAFTARDNLETLQPFLNGLIDAVRSGNAEGYHALRDEEIKRSEEDWFIRAGGVKAALQANPLPGNLNRAASFALMLIKHSSKAEVGALNDVRYCAPGWGRLNP